MKENAERTSHITKRRMDSILRLWKPVSPGSSK